MERIRCDSVVIAAGARPVQNLGEETAGVVPEIHVVGDANGPRKALDAIWEGYDVGLKLRAFRTTNTAPRESLKEICESKGHPL